MASTPLIQPRTEVKAACKARITALEPLLARICAISGTPGISIGVSFNGEAIHTFSHGHRDVEVQQPTDTNTIYPIGTLAKTFTASAINALVFQGKLQWDTLIKDILPEFKSASKTVEENLNVVDLLVQRSGLARSNYWWQGAEGALFLEKKDLLDFYATLPVTAKFRAEWGYSNWGYAILGAVIEQVSGMSYADYVALNVLEPLGLKDTTFKPLHVTKTPNLAKPYAAMDDASPYLMLQPPVSDETIMGPAMGGSSTASDLLRFAMALLESQRYESASGASKGDKEPVLKGGQMHLAGHIFTAPSMLEKSYAFGFYRSQLPNTILGMGWNSLYVKQMPQLVPGSVSLCGPVIAHGGSLPGYHSSIALLPGMNASVVVCTNSIALGDVSGWVSLAVLEALIDAPNPSNYIALATEAAGNAVKNVDRLKMSLATAKANMTAPKPLEQYVGWYVDKGHKNWNIEVQKNREGGLDVLFQGLESQKWKLTHHEGDTFVWLASREEQAKRGRMVTYPLIANHFKLIFTANGERNIDGVCWPHEAGVKVEKQRFEKEV
ncbi:MAG: hypothetical protein Q9166_006656 [cf. Caloplaca sp. 2 TL-2023]